MEIIDKSAKIKMLLKNKLQHFLKSDWFISLILFSIFFATNGYIYGWDDQHLEIPLLKSLINNSLYQGDYYVESLKQNFPSYFYIILSKFISTKQIPAAYFTLYVLSRYFLFFWSYKLWHLITKNKFSAFFCVLTFTLIGRVEEFLYRTFSHQEFALAIIMAGIYYFYKKRYILAAVILGIAINFHAIYSVFVMLYMGFYLLIRYREYGFKTLLKTSGAFLICALPLAYLVVQKFTNTHIPSTSPILDDWLGLFRVACPQNFLFHEIPLQALSRDISTFLRATQKFLILGALYTLNYRFLKEFREDNKIHVITLTAVIFLFISFFFTYMLPSRFVIDLNLIRNIQYLLFFLTGYMAFLILTVIKEKGPWIAMQTALILALFRLGELTALLAITYLFALLSFMEQKELSKRRFTLLAKGGYLLIMGGCLVGIGYQLYSINFHPTTRNIFLLIAILLLAHAALNKIYQKFHWSRNLKYLFVIIPLVLMFINQCFYHKRYLDIADHGKGFWQLQRSWIDMQEYVQKNTPINALFLVPHDTEMGGFRIRSERKIVASYRDCGIIGFDYSAAVEWQNRLNDIEPFKVIMGSNGPGFETALQNGVEKYKANYIVFMRYAKPPDSLKIFTKEYENPIFLLYRVNINPVVDPIYPDKNGQ